MKCVGEGGCISMRKLIFNRQNWSLVISATVLCFRNCCVCVCGDFIGGVCYAVIHCQGQPLLVPIEM